MQELFEKHSRASTLSEANKRGRRLVLHPGCKIMDMEPRTNRYEEKDKAKAKDKEDEEVGAYNVKLQLSSLVVELLEDGLKKIPILSCCTRLPRNVMRRWHLHKPVKNYSCACKSWTKNSRKP